MSKRTPEEFDAAFRRRMAAFQAPEPSKGKLRMARLELVIRCKDCGEDVDTWDLTEGNDPHTHVAEMAGDLDLEHECSASEANAARAAAARKP